MRRLLKFWWCGGSRYTTYEASSTDSQALAVFTATPQSEASEVRLSGEPMRPAQSRTNRVNVLRSSTFCSERTSRSR